MFILLQIYDIYAGESSVWLCDFVYVLHIIFKAHSHTPRNDVYIDKAYIINVYANLYNMFMLIKFPMKICNAIQ